MLPFLKRLRVLLTGIRSVSFFSFSGLTFACARGIVQHSFRTQATCLCQSCRRFAMIRRLFCETRNSFTFFLGFYGVFRKSSQIPKGYRETGYIWANFDFREMVWEFGNYSRKREFFKDF